MVLCWLLQVCVSGRKSLKRLREFGLVLTKLSLELVSKVQLMEDNRAVVEVLLYILGVYSGKANGSTRGRGACFAVLVLPPCLSPEDILWLETLQDER